ncbi:MFS transporter [Micromonospora sp. AMSO31t]|uniref:MFS transporter n=1 Tax=Micromonospora sp. AMSO31t TaxID=2650566 RepID=UPI001CECFB06|nr:MFS transporter [Micromonospora sp. AMSO31t]
MGPVESGRISHGGGFWLVTYAFAVTMAFSGAPAPLYVLYQQRDGFGAFTVTLIFAAYAIGVVASLFLAGHISDWVGRRRILLPAILINMLAGAIFLIPGVPALLVARFVSGISIGMLTATATAHLTELHLTARPGESRVRADLVATAANLGGIGMGPLIAGILAEYAPHPLSLPYLVFEALLLLGAVAVALVPETVERRSIRSAYRPQRVTVPIEARPRYFSAGAVGLTAFAVFGLFTSLAPGFLAGTLHQRSHALAGLVAFLVFASGAIAQILIVRIPLARQLRLGLGALAAGLALLTLGVWTASMTLFLAGGILAGAGAGAAFKGAITTVLGLAPSKSRGEALAGLFLAAYIGLAVPVLGLGLATQFLPTRIALLGFTAALLAVLIVGSRRLLRPADNR